MVHGIQQANAEREDKDEHAKFKKAGRNAMIVLGSFDSKSRSSETEK